MDELALLKEGLATEVRRAAAASTPRAWCWCCARTGCPSPTSPIPKAW